jgi:hypothetical protein
MFSDDGELKIESLTEITSPGVARKHCLRLIRTSRSDDRPALVGCCFITVTKFESLIVELSSKLKELGFQVKSRTLTQSGLLKRVTGLHIECTDLTSQTEYHVCCDRWVELPYRIDASEALKSWLASSG